MRNYRGTENPFVSWSWGRSRGWEIWAAEPNLLPYTRTAVLGLFWVLMLRMKPRALLMLSKDSTSRDKALFLIPKRRMPQETLRMFEDLAREKTQAAWDLLGAKETLLPGASSSESTWSPFHSSEIHRPPLGPVEPATHHKTPTTIELRNCQPLQAL